MRTSHTSSLARIGSALALVLALAGCTKGGQFDPTELMNTEMFESKKKLSGPREPLFPNGVPGATTGVPSDLVKGYQPPPDQAAASDIPAAPEPVKPKPKAMPKPKPKIARAPPAPARTQINVGLRPGAPAQQERQSSQSVWPAAPATAPAANAPASQSVWPAPPSTGPARQAAQPSGSIWPDPPAPGTSSQ
jgi:hypothetical protein